MSAAPAGTLAEALRRRLPAATVATPLAGIEHELAVWSGTRRVDFRTVLPALPGLGPAIDPSDSNARRGAWGGVLTADGREAEIATPPAALAPGSPTR